MNQGRRKMMTARIVAGVLALALVTFVTQGYLVLKDLNEAESKALQVWSDSHPGGADEVAAFRQCLKDATAEQMSQPKPVAPTNNVQKCATQAAGPALAISLKMAMDSVQVPAPLRWL